MAAFDLKSIKISSVLLKTAKNSGFYNQRYILNGKYIFLLIKPTNATAKWLYQ